MIIELINSTTYYNDKLRNDTHLLIALDKSQRNNIFIDLLDVHTELIIVNGKIQPESQ